MVRFSSIDSELDLKELKEDITHLGQSAEIYPNEQEQELHEGIGRWSRCFDSDIGRAGQR